MALVRFLKHKDTTTGRYKPGDIAVFESHEANYLINMRFAEPADDVIETACLETDNGIERRRSLDGN